tara:strand:+ start:1455 stop:2246 length:792 start_codon:yes stop_codon:yes gene_type:complete
MVKARKTVQTKHNAKSLRKYKTKELREYIKTNKLPIKRTSKLSKADIISAMLKIQRNGQHQCLAKMPFKGKKLLSDKQLLGLQKGQNVMREKNLKLKNQVKTSLKLDKQVHTSVQITPTIIEEIKDEIRKEGIKKEVIDTEEPGLVRGGVEEIGMFQEILNIEDLIERSNKNIERDIKYFNNLLTEQEIEELEEEKEELEQELAETIEKKDIAMLSVVKLKEILKENNIRGYSKLNKQELVELVYKNKEEIDNLDVILFHNIK